MEKALESSLDSKGIKPVNPKGKQPWLFIGKTDVKAKSPIIWPPDAKSWLIGKDSCAQEDWEQEEKEVAEDNMVRQHRQLNGHEFEQTLGDSEGQGSLVWYTPWDHKESNNILWLNSKKKILLI